MQLLAAELCAKTIISVSGGGGGCGDGNWNDNHHHHHERGANSDANETTREQNRGKSFAFRFVSFCFAFSLSTYGEAYSGYISIFFTVALSIMIHHDSEGRDHNVHLWYEWPSLCGCCPCVCVSFHFEIETSKHFPALVLRAAGKAQTQGARG